MGDRVHARAAALARVLLAAGPGASIRADKRAGGHMSRNTPQQQVENSRAWRQANHERYLEQNRAAQARWRRRNKHHAAARVQRHRGRVWAKTQGRCYLCGGALDDVWEIDHVSPISKGGSDHLSNLLPACFKCNRWKRDKLLLPVVSRG